MYIIVCYIMLSYEYVVRFIIDFWFYSIQCNGGIGLVQQGYIMIAEVHEYTPYHLYREKT